MALAAHLGGPNDLSLRSASGPLRLLDAGGVRSETALLRIQWRREALAAPLRLERLVLGPFASFESAEAAAGRWRSAGAQPVVARPGDWEVWAPPGSPAPPGDPPRRVERLETLAWVPHLVNGSQRQPLQAPIRIEAPGGLRWNSGVFQGPFRLQPDAHGGWTLVEQVPLERYLLGVVPHEIGAGAPAAALAAQAVLARTWALRNQHRFEVDGYHLCADTQCQVYGDPRLAGGSVGRAVTVTAGKVLTWRGQPIHAVYHASNGGVSAAFEEGWAGDSLPYLQAAPDGPPSWQAALTPPLDERDLVQLLRSGNQAHGADHPRFRWQRRLDAASLTAAGRAVEPGFGQANRVTVLERGPSGRVLALQISGTPATSPVVLRRDAIRRQLRQLPSTLFVVHPDGPGRWRFEGGGFGHGAGLSQAGAIDLASRGWTLEQILARYYPGTQLLPLSALQRGGP
ncbi:MAG: SpoIID/LytB domain-containing protein [Cyanobacteriota bacterium]|nr:SpoIID/LytB domain-containing protein [Cyanobacteriota bacterium]